MAAVPKAVVVWAASKVAAMEASRAVVAAASRAAEGTALAAMEPGAGEGLDLVILEADHQEVARVVHMVATVVACKATVVAAAAVLGWEGEASWEMQECRALR